MLAGTAAVVALASGASAAVARAQGMIEERETSAPIASSLAYLGELVNVAAGGARRGSAYSGVAAAQLTLRLHELVGWRGARALVLLLGTHGGSPSALVGDLQGVSDLEAPSGINVGEAWIQQSMFGGRVSLLAGRFDLSTEFDFTRTGTLFLNNSLGIGPEFALSGERGPSVYPFTFAGARLAVRATRHVVARVALLADGLRVGEIALVAREDSAATRVVSQLDAGRGVPQAYSTKLAVGGWYYDLRLPDLVDLRPDGTPVQLRGSHGFYLIADRTLWRAPHGAPGALSGFLQLGIGDPRVVPIGRYVGGGVAMLAPLASRAQDEVGLAVATALTGSHFARAQAERRRDATNEVALEMTYFAQVTSWLAVQPDVQLVLNAGGTRESPDALVLGLVVTLTREIALVRGTEKRLTRRAAAPPPPGRSRTGASSRPARR